MGRRMRALPFAASAVVASLVLTVSGCGDDEQVSAEVPAPAAIVETPTTASGTPSAGENTALPDVQVVRVASGQTAPLRSLAAAGQPMLLWFWAPHCTFCRAEAPALLEFRKTYGDRIQILGLGAQDDLKQAKDFLADTNTRDLEMVWDDRGRTWQHFKVTNQPTVVVVDAAGKVTRTWFREFDAKGIVAAAGLA